MNNTTDAVSAAISRAERVTPPEIAILLECAAESEPDRGSAEALEAIVANLKDAAMTARRITDLPRVVTEVAGSAGTERVGLQTARADAMAGARRALSLAEAEEFALSHIAGRDIRELAPIIVGIGIASSRAGADDLSRRALFRDADRGNPAPQLAEAERRLLGGINRLGVGVGGLGGRSTALAVHIERDGEDAGWCVVSIGDYLTSYAKILL
jgi:tartrate dehydratase alpha subunit/fumarate hydratase class I-like protein